MAVHINNEGDLIITIKKQEHFTSFDELELRRCAIYDALQEHNNKDFIGSDLHYGLTTILKDLDPTFEQWKTILNNPEL
jgi:hypothetical protein